MFSQFDSVESNDKVRFVDGSEIQTGIIIAGYPENLNYSSGHSDSKVEKKIETVRCELSAVSKFVSNILFTSAKSSIR